MKKMLCLWLLPFALVMSGCGSSDDEQADSTTVVPTSGTTASTAVVATSLPPTTVVNPVVTWDRSCEKSAMTTLEMEDCARSQLTALDAQLATVQAAYFQRYPDRAARGDEFLQYRDSECNPKGNKDANGSSAGVSALNCKIDMTAARIKELQSL